METPSVKAGVCGRYRFTRITVDENDNEVDRYQTPWMENIITNNGLDFIGQHKLTSCFTHCYLGDKTSPSTPDATDTQLQSKIASTGSHSTSNSSHTSSSPYYHGIIATYHFGKGAAQGTLTEVGTGRGSQDLFSRALILDAAGSPTSLTIGHDDKLDVEYEFRVYFDEGDTTGTFSMTNPGDSSPTTYSYTVRMANIGSLSNGDFYTMYKRNGGRWNLSRFYDGPIGPITSHPTGNSFNGSIHADTGYTNGTYKQNVDLSIGPNKSFGSGQFDPGTGVKSVAMYGNGGAGYKWYNGWEGQIEFSPTIPLTELDKLVVTISLSWAQYTPPSW